MQQVMPKAFRKMELGSHPAQTLLASPTHPRPDLCPFPLPCGDSYGPARFLRSLTRRHHVAWTYGISSLERIVVRWASGDRRCQPIPACGSQTPSPIIHPERATRYGEVLTSRSQPRADRGSAQRTCGDPTSSETPVMPEPGMILQRTPTTDGKCLARQQLGLDSIRYLLELEKCERAITYSISPFNCQQPDLVRMKGLRKP